MASEPGQIAVVMGKLAYAFAETQPMLPTYTHVILAAIFPIIAGAYASLARPNTAARPKKGTKGRKGESQEEEDDFQRMEGLAPSDALFFPLYAGVTLTGLYYLIKWLQDPTLLNKLLNWHFAVVGLYGVCKFISDGLHLIHEFAFPDYYLGGSGIWHVDQDKSQTILVDGVSPKTRKSPLPGLFGLIPLPKWTLARLWSIRNMTAKNQKLTLRFYIHKVVAVKVHFDLLNVVAAALGIVATLYFNLVERKWWLTNIFAFSFSYVSLQHISPTTFVTATILLSGLFIYDIYMVFYTPMMVTVAKNLDIPAKLLFPRPSITEEGKLPGRDFAMLGLGDVVLPGLVIGLALRFDAWLHYLSLQKKQTSVPQHPEDTDVSEQPEEIIKAQYISPSRYWASRLWAGRSKSVSHIYLGTFKKPYFITSLVGYVLGLMTTLGIMQYFHHAQPALLYLVPAVLGSLFLTGLVRGELKLMWEFTEEELDEEEADSSEKMKETEPKEQKPRGILASLWSDIKKDLSSRKSKSTPETTEKDKRRSSAAKVEELEKAIVGQHVNRNELLHFSIVRFENSGSAGAKTEDGKGKGPNWIEVVPVTEPISLDSKDTVVGKENTEPGHVSKRLRTR